MVHGELINAFKRDYRDDKDKEFVALIRSLAKKYPESFEKAKYQLMGYAWLWQATRKPLYADISIAILRQMLSVYSDRIVDHAHYERTIAEIEKKRDRPKEPILWPPVPR